jgi:hypothetical protein
MAFKIKDGVRIGTVDVFNNAGALLVAAPSVANSLTAGAGLTGGPYNGSGAVTIAHSNTVTAGTASEGGVTRTLAYGGTFNIPSVTHDANGHITARGSIALTLPAATAAANNGTLTLGLGTAAATANAITIGTGTGFSADTASNLTYDIKVGPALTNLATLMTTATAGFIRRTGQDTYAVDTNTYLTSYTETDTLQTVTGRGASSNVATITLSAATASSGTGSGTLVVTGGVGIGGNLNVGGNFVLTGNLTVNGTTTTVNSTTTTLDDPIITLGGDTAPASDDNKDRGVEFRWHNSTVAKLGFFGFDDSTGKFTFIPDATNASEVFSGTKGTLDANIEWADVLNKPTIPVKATSTTLGTIELWDNAVQTTTANTVTTTASRTYGIQLNANDQAVVNVPWTDTLPNSGALTLGIGTAGATNTSVTIGTGTGFNANSTSAFTYDIKIGPALTNLATLMTTATAGFIRRTGQDTYAVDTNTYLTSYTETDTLQTVTTRGNTTTTNIQLNGSALVLAVSTTPRIHRQALAPANITVNTAVAVDTWPVATYRSVKYTIQVTQGSKYQVSEVRMIHDGSLVYLTEFSVLETNSAVPIPVTFTAAIATGTLTVNATITDAATTNAAVIIERTLTTV